MKTLFLTTGLLALGMTVSASAGDYVCKNGSTERTIQVVKPTDGQYVCEVIYAKPSEGVPGKMLWHARNDENFCHEKADALASRLSSAGWACEAQSGANQSAAGGLTTPPPAQEQAPAPQAEEPAAPSETGQDGTPQQ